MRQILTALALVLLSFPLAAQSPVAGPPALPPDSIGEVLYVADFSNDAIYAVRDENGDGDANDAGEISIFYDDSSPDPALHLATVRFLAVDAAGSVYVADSNMDFILRLTDGDADGNANGVGEAQIYYDVNSGGVPPASMSNIAFDELGYLYLSDTGTAGSTNRHITRIRDENGDGFCSEADGEVFLIYSRDTTTGTPIERTSGLVIEPDGTIIGSDFETDALFRFVDTTGAEDGDADDAGEQIEVYNSASGGAVLDFAESLALGIDTGMGRPLYVNGGPTEDSIYRFFDADGDGFFQPSETAVYWDVTQADGIAPANARTLAVTPTGQIYALEAGATGVEEKIVILEDLNGDLDANDAGEARIFADNSNASGILFSQPQGMAFSPGMPPPDDGFIRSDCNADGGTDISDPIVLLNELFVEPQNLPCEKPCDSNDDGMLDVADAVYSLQFLFSMGPLPPSPFPDCGSDPTLDALEPCVALPICP